MENASEALIITGGIFLAIVLITFGVYTYSSMNKLAKTQDEQVAQQQLVEFNKSYEAYNRGIMYGTDLITVMNKANDNNKTYKGSDFKITISFVFTEKNLYIYDPETGKREKGSEFFAGTDYTNENYETKIKDNPDAFNDFKRRLFKCKSVNYNPKTGRINEMYFEEVKLSNDEKNYLRK